MNIVIFVSSHTGHTLQVSEAVQKALAADGHSVRLEKIEPVETAPLVAETVPLKTHPHIADEDEGVILASPVNGGRISAPMRSWLVGNSGSLHPYRVAFLLTHIFGDSLGTKHALQEFSEICGHQKNASIIGHADVRWLSLFRKNKIKNAVDEIVTLFKE
jgi:multimeric flavodoxin WrbA